MFDWNGNGKHDAFDDFFTFELFEDMMNEEDEMPSVRNRNRRIHRRYDIYQDTNSARKNAITTFWLVLGLIILIVGFYSDNLQYQRSTSDSTFYIRFSIYQLYCNVTGL